MIDAADLPDDIEALKAIIIASEGRIDRLEKLVADFKRALFGARSEKVNSDQYDLALEDIETAMAAIRAEDDTENASPITNAKPIADLCPNICRV